MMYKNKIVLGLCLAMACLTVVAVVPKIVHAATICDPCKGTGKILELRSVCDICYGSGEADGFITQSIMGKVRCWRCSGKGWIAPSCNYCGGRGKILTQAEKDAERKATEEREATAKRQREEWQERTRQAKSYTYTGRTVKIGNRTWMAENLNNEAAGGKCYGNDPSNCVKYGRLYTWNEAMIACPTGWHLPSDNEWDTLMVEVGGGVKGKNKDGEFSWKTAGKILKSESGWNNNGNGTDEFGFSALPGGRGGKNFSDVGNDGYWWSTTENNGWIWSRHMHYGNEDVGSDAYRASVEFSVRCVVDKEVELKIAAKEMEMELKKIATKEEQRLNKLKSYKYTGRTVKIGNQTWMAENLNSEAAGGKCYRNNPSNCAKYGRLYTWPEAVKACPAGWHLPTDKEWTALTDAVGGAYVAGKKLKSSSGWNNNGNGTNEYGFSALPGGYGYGGYFFYADSSGYWWSATENNASNAWRRNMYYISEVVNRYYDDKTYGLSVRCVKD